MASVGYVIKQIAQSFASGEGETATSMIGICPNNLDSPGMSHTLQLHPLGLP